MSKTWNHLRWALLALVLVGTLVSCIAGLPKKVAPYEYGTVEAKTKHTQLVFNGKVHVPVTRHETKIRRNDGTSRTIHKWIKGCDQGSKVWSNGQEMSCDPALLR